VDARQFKSHLCYLVLLSISVDFTGLIFLS